MGGFGSGRKSQGGKATTRDYLVLDIRSWKRGGLLVEGREFNWFWPLDDNKTSSIHVRIEVGQARLFYRLSPLDKKSNDENEECAVKFSRTKCNFGGTRVWFKCPAKGCGRQVAILYFDGIFACRHCQNLAYDSQREIPADRAMRIAFRLRQRLGWSEGILDLPGSRPKGMHKRTFEKLQAKHQALLDAIGDYALKKFGIEVV